MKSHNGRLPTRKLTMATRQRCDAIVQYVLLVIERIETCLWNFDRLWRVFLWSIPSTSNFPSTRWFCIECRGWPCSKLLLSNKSKFWLMSTWRSSASTWQRIESVSVNSSLHRSEAQPEFMGLWTIMYSLNVPNQKKQSKIRTKCIKKVICQETRATPTIFWTSWKPKSSPKVIFEHSDQRNTRYKRSKFQRRVSMRSMTSDTYWTTTSQLRGMAIVNVRVARRPLCDVIVNKKKQWRVV